MEEGESHPKECWYAILGVERTASAEVIRSSYRKEALKWHPDKIQQSGATPQECQNATIKFQRIAQAYEVLSDPVERAWYDKHRNEILSSGSASKDFEFNVWSFFSASIFSGFGESGKGFYKVYGDVFRKIHKKEQAFAKAYGLGPIGEAPEIGVLNTPYDEVTKFYSHWQGFSTIKDFSWCDQYRISDARSRKERRLMEEENGKIRKRERRDFNDAVRQLATQVKKRDKRVLDMQIELLRVQKEKDEQLKLKRQQEKAEKLARARAYEEQEWSKLGDDIYDEDEDIYEDEGSYNWRGSSKGKKSSEPDEDHELYCIVCSKRFRSEKQWTNHEKSKKHIERAVALKQTFLEEDEQADALTKNLEVDEDHNSGEENSNRVDQEKEQEGLSNNDEDVTIGKGSVSGSTGGSCNEPQKHSASLKPSSKNWQFEDEEDDDEDAVLTAMMNSQRSRQSVRPVEVRQSERPTVDGDDYERRDERKEGGLEQEDGSDEDNNVEEEDDEDSLLAAMMSSHRSRLTEQSADAEVTVNVHSHNNSTETGQNSEEVPTSESTDDETPSVADGDDDEDNMLASMLNSGRNRGQSAIDEQTDPSDEAGISSLVNGSGQFGNEDEDDEKNSTNAGKAKLRRRSKQEKQQRAARARHDAILKELSHTHEPGEVKVNGSDSALKSLETGRNPVIGEGEDSLSSTGGKKPKLRPRQKPSKEVVPVKQTVTTSNLNIEVPLTEPAKKGVRARGKKGKALPKPPASNTCDTCGEDFESRNQLFKHITVSNHSSLKTK